MYDIVLSVVFQSVQNEYANLNNVFLFDVLNVFSHKIAFKRFFILAMNVIFICGSKRIRIIRRDVSQTSRCYLRVGRLISQRCLKRDLRRPTVPKGD